MAKNDSGKVLAARPQRGVKADRIQHATTYEISEDGMFRKVGRKGNSYYQEADRFVPSNPDFESGATQNVGKPAQSGGLRDAISLIRGK